MILNIIDIIVKNIQ